jgi:predicted RNase H-like nuclease (RuvC/YqgF family)
MTGDVGPEHSPPPGAETEAGGWKLSWGRFLEFGKNILDLERSVAALKSENRELRKELHELQRQVDRLAGKLEGISGFIAGSVEDKIDAKVVEAETRAFERLLAMVRGSQREIE